MPPLIVRRAAVAVSLEARWIVPDVTVEPGVADLTTVFAPDIVILPVELLRIALPVVASTVPALTVTPPLELLKIALPPAAVFLMAVFAPVILSRSVVAVPLMVIVPEVAESAADVTGPPEIVNSPEPV